MFVPVYCVYWVKESFHVQIRVNCSHDETYEMLGPTRRGRCLYEREGHFLQTHRNLDNQSHCILKVFSSCLSHSWISRVFRLDAFFTSKPCDSLWSWENTCSYVKAGCWYGDISSAVHLGRFQQPAVIHGHLWKCWFVWNVSVPSSQQTKCLQSDKAMIAWLNWLLTEDVSKHNETFCPF